MFVKQFYKKISQLSHKKQTAAAPRGQSYGQIGGRPLSHGHRVHSFVVALIYPQPCRTMHPPVEFMTVLNACPLVARRRAHARFARAKQNLTKSLFQNPIFFRSKKLKNKRFADFMG